LKIAAMSRQLLPFGGVYDRTQIAAQGSGELRQKRKPRARHPILSWQQRMDSDFFK
jgi:hypothetical protein